MTETKIGQTNVKLASKLAIAILAPFPLNVYGIQSCLIEKIIHEERSKRAIEYERTRKRVKR